MNVLFLDIDGVLNNFTALGIHHDKSTLPHCIQHVNEIITSTNCKVVIISSWKDAHPLIVVKDILYARGLLKDSIAGATEKDAPKEKGILQYISDFNVAKYIIIDDDIKPFSDLSLKMKMITPNTFVGINEIDTKLAIKLFAF